MNIEITGIDAVVAELSGAIDEFERSVNQLIQDAGMTGVGQAVSVVPVRTGHLQDSITYDSPGYLMSEFYTDVYYSAFVEFGTSKMQERPYMMPAYEVATNKLLQDIQEL